MSKKSFMKVKKDLKHTKTGKRVRTLHKHLCKDYTWLPIESYQAVPNSTLERLVRTSAISLDGVPVRKDIKHVFFIMLTDTKQELAQYLLDEDHGLRKFAELRLRQLESGTDT